MTSPLDTRGSRPRTRGDGVAGVIVAYALMLLAALPVAAAIGARDTL